MDRIIACTTNEAAIAKLLKKHPMEALKTKIAGQVLVQAEHLPKDRSALEPIFQVCSISLLVLFHPYIVAILIRSIFQEIQKYHHHPSHISWYDFSLFLLLYYLNRSKSSICRRRSSISTPRSIQNFRQKSKTRREGARSTLLFFRRFNFFKIILIQHRRRQCLATCHESCSFWRPSLFQSHELWYDESFLLKIT